jgi:hypothetical protein
MDQKLIDYLMEYEKGDFTYEADMDESAAHSEAWAYTTT